MFKLIITCARVTVKIEILSNLCLMFKCIKNYKTGLQQRSEQKSEAYLNLMILSVVNLVLLLGGGGCLKKLCP